MDYGKVPPLLFWGLLLVWLLPWSAFLPQALRQVRFRLREIGDRRDVSQAAALLFFAWAAVILVFFSFSTRQEYYVAPVLPALALLIGIWLAHESQASAEGTPVPVYPAATSATPAQTKTTPAQRATLTSSPKMYFAPRVPTT
jgi:4-amino-4-deoxy-L-arabinose transferase-like glycosyltransferase